MIAELLTQMNTTLSDALTTILPENEITAFIIANALLVVTVLLVLIITGFLATAFFFDFVKDAWKLPFAVVVDIGKYFSLFIPWLALVQGIAGAMIFIFLSNAGNVLKWVFAAISFAMGVLIFIYPESIWVIIMGVAPVNTSLMFISTIID